MPLIGEYNHRGIANDFEATDVSLWDSGEDHKVTLECTDDISASKTLNVNELTHWVRTSDTYSSVEYVSMLPASTTSNVTAVVGGKGTGGVQAQVADGTSTGGDNRGSNATDFQQVRTSANQVASAARSAILNGQNNRSSATDAASGGQDCVASGDTAWAYGNTAVASGTHSNAQGRDVTADAGYAHVRGRDGHAHARYGSDTFASGDISTQGDCQSGKMLLRGISTSATPIVLTSDGAAASTSNQLVLQADSVITFQGMVAAYNTSTNQVGSYCFEGVIKRPAAAAGTVLLASTVNTIYENVAGLDLTLAADTTNGSVKVSFTGAASATYDVACVIGWVEVQ